jgi:hypothetical protein
MCAVVVKALMQLVVLVLAVAVITAAIAAAALAAAVVAAAVACCVVFVAVSCDSCMGRSCLRRCIQCVQRTCYQLIMFTQRSTLSVSTVLQSNANAICVAMYEWNFESLR